MSVGQDNERGDAVNADEASRTLHGWFEDTYATSPVASLIIGKDERVVFCNDAAYQLLAMEKIVEIDDLEACRRIEETKGFGDIVRRASRPGSALSSWKGHLNTPTRRPLEVRFTPLPGPEHFVLCRLITFDHIGDETQVQLISSLARIYHEQSGFDDAGNRVVNVIHDRLKTPVVAVWKDEERPVHTWAAGDEELCHRLAAGRADIRDDHDERVVFCTDDELGRIDFRFDLGASSSAHITIATRTSTHQLDPSNPFWNCLAATAEAALQSAYLLEHHREDRLRLRAVIEHMPMAVLIFDRRGEVIDLNLRARAMVGRYSWTKIGPSDHPFEVCDVEGNVLPRESWPFLRALRTGEPCEEEEYILDFGDRKRHISISIIPIVDPRGQVTSYLATGRDVTRRSKADRRKDEFLSVASHELRSPLTPLAGFLQLSRQQAESEHTVDPDILRRAEAQVQRLQRLIDSLLDTSRLETGKLPIQRRSVEMNGLVTRVMEPWLDGHHGERIELVLPDEPIQCSVDPDRIDQVLTNVVDNAVKHGRPDGRIRVKLIDEEAWMVLTVQDEGDGIPQAVIDRVFDRFFYQPNHSSSMGLGLYISRQLVNDHDGTITIDSGRNQPTTVTIRLPIAEIADHR